MESLEFNDELMPNKALQRTVLPSFHYGKTAAELWRYTQGIFIDHGKESWPRRAG